MIDVKRRDEQKKTESKKVYESGTKKGRVQTRQKSQNWDDENESASDSEYEPLRIARYPAVGAGNNKLEAGPSNRNVSSTPVTATGRKSERSHPTESIRMPSWRRRSMSGKQAVCLT